MPKTALRGIIVGCSAFQPCRQFNCMVAYFIECQPELSSEDWSLTTRRWRREGDMETDRQRQRQRNREGGRDGRRAEGRRDGGTEGWKEFASGRERLEGGGLDGWRRGFLKRRDFSLKSFGMRDRKDLG